MQPQPISRSQLRALNFHLNEEGIIQPGRRVKSDSDLDSVTTSASVVAEDSSQMNHRTDLNPQDSRLESEKEATLQLHLNLVANNLAAIKDNVKAKLVR